MPRPPDPPRPTAIAGRWLVLALLSLALAWPLARWHVPAAPLLASIAVAIVLAARGRAVDVPPLAFAGAQALVGCMIARSMPSGVAGEVVRAWPLFLASVGAVIVVAALLGWALARWRLLPGTTAVWGSFPGAATAMVLMAEAYGADVRLVALMQYLRVLVVGVVASTVTRLWLPVHPGVAGVLVPAGPPLDAVGLAQTFAVAAAGIALARRLRVAAGALLIPMFAGIALQAAGWVRIELPGPLLLACYALVGWSIGLRFTPDILRHAARLLPRVLASILALVASCGVLAFALARLAHVDALTAYLATSPGGADTVAIIAASSPVDVPFVMAMQSARFLVIAFAGPTIARFIADRL